MKRTAEAVVIGGGCHGASIAYNLVKRGMKGVVLVEKNFIASGSTSKSSAIVREHYTFPELIKIARRNTEIFTNFQEIVGGDAGFIQTGEIILVSPHNRQQLLANLDMLKELGVRGQLLSATEIGEIQPQLAPEKETLVVYHPDTGYANPVATTAAFALRAQELGASLEEETEAIAIKQQGGRIRSVLTNRDEISTPIVVNAAGPWGGKIASMVGIDLLITPTRHQMTTFRRPWDFYQNYFVYVDFTGELAYSRPEVKDLALVCVDHTSQEKADPGHYEDNASEGNIVRCLEWQKRLFPVMKRASFRGGYAGVYDTTPDEYPLVGGVEEVAGFYCDVGWSGTGFKHSPTIGELMAELITTGRTTLVDLAIFRPSRFREGQPITSYIGYTGSQSEIRETRD